ncbi:unnamed protein product [Moneuplotes crassus]|uniref:Uncharacterized protein n=1 Tax=Euplotes crassus TaxID=5936 RepID=A0AAD1Y3N7_EUPCR|nr:unnamed protein product [Moneuplotes crassus]
MAKHLIFEKIISSLLITKLVNSAYKIRSLNCDESAIDKNLLFHGHPYPCLRRLFRLISDKSLLKFAFISKLFIIQDVISLFSNPDRLHRETAFVKVACGESITLLR